MRYLLNTLFGLTILLVGFAHGQTALANLIVDETPPTITDSSIEPMMWFVDEVVGGLVRIDANDNTDPALYNLILVLSTDGPIVIGCSAGCIMTPNGGDLSGYFNAFLEVPFSYTPDTVIGDFMVFFDVVDAAGNQVSSDLSYTIKPIPEPSTLALFGIGLAGLGFMTRRRRIRRRQT